MHLSKIRIINFRRLADAIIDLDRDISIFVGANNSGKTSVAHALQFFVKGTPDHASFYDISACRWDDINAFEEGNDGASLPVLLADLWFDIEQADLHRVIDLLPRLEWDGSKVGVRIAFVPRNEVETLTRFEDRRTQAQEAVDRDALEGADPYVVSPKSLREFLEKEFRKEYEFKYFVLDEAQFNNNFHPNDGYEPQELLRDQGRVGKDIVNSLIKVDFLGAQRHLSDSEGGGRTEELSSHLSRYYRRNLARHEDDYNAIKALAESETRLNEHLARVFAGTVQHLEQLGYPGLTNPRLMIKSALNPVAVMTSQDGAHVHYALNDEGLTLPDKYNGLGFKNLIYMVVELLDLHGRWLATEEKCQPVHLLFVEEPEAHLHAPLQQVFVNKVLEILRKEDELINGLQTQLALTTHSSHILYERNFKCVRYFQRKGTGVEQNSNVLNLSKFYQSAENSTHDFLERYLKLTHCDLFFADAAVLVEGTVERLLMPQMIERAASGLRSCYLSVLEIGGAHAHRFRELIERLGITTLVVTDLDSVYKPNAKDGTPGSTCLPEAPGAITSNQMLAQWLPRRTRIDELLETNNEDKAVRASPFGPCAIRVAYPGTVDLEFGDEQIRLAGRTFEVAFAFENLEWTQEEANKDLKLRMGEGQPLEELARRLHNKVHGPDFKKTDFALALLAKDPNAWRVPRYIDDGLKWLADELDIAVDNGGRHRGNGA